MYTPKRPLRKWALVVALPSWLAIEAALCVRQRPLTSSKDSFELIGMGVWECELGNYRWITSEVNACELLTANEKTLKSLHSKWNFFGCLSSLIRFSHINQRFNLIMGYHYQQHQPTLPTRACSPSRLRVGITALISSESNHRSTSAETIIHHAVNWW